MADSANKDTTIWTMHTGSTEGEVDRGDLTVARSPRILTHTVSIRRPQLHTRPRVVTLLVVIV